MRAKGGVLMPRSEKRVVEWQNNEKLAFVHLSSLHRHYQPYLGILDLD